jgi:hypothetical protein
VVSIAQNKNRNSGVVVLIALNKNRDTGVVVSIHIDEGSVTLRRAHTPNTAQKIACVRCHQRPSCRALQRIPAVSSAILKVQNQRCNKSLTIN